MSILPFAILIVLITIVTLVVAARKTISYLKNKKPVPVITLITLIASLGITAFLLRITIALTIGLEHSRSPFEYTKLYGILCWVFVFIVPGIIILVLHFKIKRNKE